MTFQIGQLVKCIDAETHFGHQHPYITFNFIYTVRNVHESGEHIQLEGPYPNVWLKATRFVLGNGLSTEMPTPIPKTPAIVLNAEAKGKAKPKVDDTQWIPHVTSHGEIPVGSVPCTHEQYIENPTLVALAPVWVKIKTKIPGQFREYVYDALKIAFSSPDTSSLRPRAIRVVDVFTWSSTPQRSMWRYLNEALDTGNWSKFNDYVESSSTA
jgi:hypothetical protein